MKIWPISSLSNIKDFFNIFLGIEQVRKLKELEHLAEHQRVNMMKFPL